MSDFILINHHTLWNIHLKCLLRNMSQEKYIWVSSYRQKQGKGWMAVLVGWYLKRTMWEVIFFSFPAFVSKSKPKYFFFKDMFFKKHLFHSVSQNSKLDLTLFHMAVCSSSLSKNTLCYRSNKKIVWALAIVHYLVYK